MIVGVVFWASRQSIEKVADDNSTSIEVALPVATTLLADDCHWRLGEAIDACCWNDAGQQNRVRSHGKTQGRVWHQPFAIK